MAPEVTEIAPKTPKRDIQNSVDKIEQVPSMSFNK